MNRREFLQTTAALTAGAVALNVNASSRQELDSPGLDQDWRFGITVLIGRNETRLIIEAPIALFGTSYGPFLAHDVRLTMRRPIWRPFDIASMDKFVMHGRWQTQFEVASLCGDRELMQAFVAQSGDVYQAERSSGHVGLADARHRHVCWLTLPHLVLTAFQHSKDAAERRFELAQVSAIASGVARDNPPLPAWCEKAPWAGRIGDSWRDESKFVSALLHDNMIETDE